MSDVQGDAELSSLPELTGDDPSASIRIGMKLDGRFELLDVLGEGAMGTVFLARHIALAKDVAIKVLKPEVKSRSEYARRFEREARATSSLDHPHVVRVIDFGEKPELFIVMEYIRGQSLRAYINELAEPPPISLAIQVIDQILSGLAAAHEHGIIHRDLKPDNVLLTWQGAEPFVKVVDFGLAHVEESVGFDMTLTQQGVVAGTPPYMSPEQCQSMAVTSASDLYSIGCMLTELLQLAPPFAGDSAAVVMSQQMFAPPPPLERPANAEPVPAWLESLRIELLAKHAHRRPESARAVRETLAEGKGDERRRSERGSLGEGYGRGTELGGTERLLVRVIGDAPGVEPSLRAALALYRIDVGAVPGPQIVLLDADELGAELVERVAALRAEHLEPIVCMTDPSAQQLPSLVSAGVADVLAKPVDPVRLARAIRFIERRLTRVARR